MTVLPVLAALSAAASLALLAPVRPRLPTLGRRLPPGGAPAPLLALAPLLVWLPSQWLVPAVVGAGALGYDAVLGFARSEEWGKGAAAGVTIVLLGVMIDRICRASAEAKVSDQSPAFQLTWLKSIRGVNVPTGTVRK